MTGVHAETDRPVSPVRRIAPTLAPALVVGIACSLILLAISKLASLLQEAWWTWAPATLGISPQSWYWVAGVMMATSALIAVTIVWAPGHAGPDPATTSLVSAPMPAKAIPGLLVATVLMLAGGVSLGPENPIMAATIGLAAAVGARLAKRRSSKDPASAQLWPTLALTGTIGALFGTPVAAALLLSEERADSPRPEHRPLWDAMVAPLFAAAAGSLTTMALAGPDLSLHLPAYPGFSRSDGLAGLTGIWAGLGDVGVGALVAAASAAIGMAAVALFNPLHRLFARLGRQWAAVLVGGAALSGLAILGGPVTMFKGLDEMGDLVSGLDRYTPWSMLGIVAVRLAAVLVAGTAGFRGGRIFPSLFAGVGLGLAVHLAIPALPISVAVVSGAIGMLMAVTRSGWLSFFTALVVVPDLALIPLLTVIALPAWLVVTGRALMVAPPAEAIPVTAPSAGRDA